MLNGRGGRVLFGVQPTGSATGQQVGVRTQEDISQACRDIYPWYPPSIERVPAPGASGREVLVVTVPTGNNKPYSHKGRYYQRSGATTVSMPDETHLSLVLERAHGWDRWETANSDRDYDALDEDEVHRFRDEAVRAGRAKFDSNASVADMLRALDLIGSDDRPNRAAIALFGHPDAFTGQYTTLGCRLVAVAGTELGEEFIDDVLVGENVSSSLRQAMSFCTQHLHRPVRIRGDLRAEVSAEIPPEVVREALANAFGHRDYAISGLVQVRIFYDRLEVWSPGGLHFGLTPADLYGPHSSHPWNPNIVGCLYRRGIVEQLGSGTLRMARLCVEAGLGRPVFASSSASVTCSVPRYGHWMAPDGTCMAIRNKEAVVLTLLARGPTGRGQLASHLGIAPKEVREVLVRLRDAGLVRVDGHGRGAYWTLSNG